MRRFSEIIKLSLAITVALIVSFDGVASQQNTGALSGRVTDELDGAVVGARLTLIDSKGVERSATVNEQGGFLIDGLTAGRYTARVAAKGFAPYENTEVEISNGRREVLNVKLAVAAVKAETAVNSDSGSLSANPDQTAQTIVIKGKELEALPDDTDDLADALQAMAGQPVGPVGGQLYVDGFAGGRLPAKISIREVRINQNPIAAENESPGIGRIDIFTQPGADKFHANAFLSMLDGRLNSRNPFSSNKLPFQRRQLGGSASGKIVPNRFSFFANFQQQHQGESQLISATVLEEPGLNILPLRLSVLTPRETTAFSPRLDYQLSANHSLTARYSFTGSTNKNQGVGGFNLQSRAFNWDNTEHALRLTEISVIGPSTVNETRFQYLCNFADLRGANSEPAINVLQAFFGGGSQIGRSWNRAERWDLQNYTSRAFHQNLLKFGGRLRVAQIVDVSENNFGGVFVYAGGLAPVLDADYQVTLNMFEFISSIERFRRTQILLKRGLSVDEILARGGGASQFSINKGDPRASVSQTDFSGFVQDDWRVRPNLTFSAGLRYENQNNISSDFNFAPRLAFAWAPAWRSGARSPSAVIRGGFGIFYERFSEGSVLQTRRLNGINQSQLMVRDPDFLTVPTPESLESRVAKSQIVRRVADDFQAPYSLFSALQLERQLSPRITVSAIYYNVRTKHALRQRDINAPLPGTFVIGAPGSGERPFGDIGEILLYESSGAQNENRLQVVVNGRIGPFAPLFANYSLAKVEGDAEGDFPANQYDLSGEYGPLSTDVRHRFVMGWTVNVPRLQVALNSLIIARSGLPFNITTGRDSNGDTLFTDRPAFATDLTRPGVVDTRFGALDPNPLPGQRLIPRNIGRGPSFFSVNLGLSRTFGLDGLRGSKNSKAVRQGERPARGPAPLIPGSSRGSLRENRYRLLLSVNCENLFNRANGGIPIGNLSSTLFGQSISSAGPFGGGILQSSNRRLRMQIQFEF